MIASLSGIVYLIDIPYVIINVSGVGYKVLTSTTVAANLEKGKQAQIFTYTYVREDALELFGFSKYQDLKLFEQLISISGIGPKTAIGVFSIGTGEEIISALRAGDVNFFSRVPRLGKKNAQKIIIELKNKVGGMGEFDVNEGENPGISDLMAALTSFGYSQQEAQKALRNLDGKGETVEEKLKLALKYLGK